MEIKNRALKKLVRPILYRNKKFTNSWQGGTCFIFGNGASLKYMDLKALDTYPTIAVNNLFFHDEYDFLNVKFVAMPEPLNFYPTIKNTYNGKYQKNVLGLAAKAEMKRRKDINWFVSLTNIFAGIPFSNVYYLHNFGKNKDANPKADLSGVFDLMAGGMYAGLGVAFALGFERAILVGCDYALRPQRSGHFYSSPGVNEIFDNPKTGYLNPYCDLFDFISSKLELIVLSPFDTEAHLPTLKYEDFTGKKPFRRENYEIISSDNLSVLKEAHRLGQLPNAV